MHNRALQAAIIVVVLGFIGSLLWSAVTGPGRPHVLLEGPQTLTGTLVPAELSLTRRGTHVLKVDGEDSAYAESTTLNLRSYELTEAVVTGVYRHNTDPSDLPVFLVTSIHTVDVPAVTVAIPSLGLLVRVPFEWNPEMFDDGAAFSLTGSTTPLLRVMRSSFTRLPEGVSMFVNGYNAVRIDSSDTTQTVHVQTGRSIVTFTWTPDDETSSSVFTHMLRTIVVTAQSSSQKSHSGVLVPAASSKAPPTGGSRASLPTNKPCGGPAGVLCPAGTYCAVHSPDGVGTCTPLQ